MSSSANIPGEEPGFYDPSPLEPHLLYQGEVISQVPYLDMPKPGNWQLLRTRSGRRVDDALERGNLGGLVRVVDSNLSREEWQSNNEGDFVMAVLQKRPALVLTATCDLQNNSFLQIAPIFPANSDSLYLTRLRNGEIFSVFWMAAKEPDILTDSYADLELMQSIHKSYIKRIRPDQHFRLNAERIRLLQRTITRYFGRPNSFDCQTDLVPRSGTYLCVSCFYLNGQATGMAFEEGARFSPCPTCNGRSWVIRGRN